MGEMVGRRRDSSKPTLAERLAAKSAELDRKRDKQRERYDQTRAEAGLPGAGAGRQDLRAWVKAHRSERIAEFAGLHLFADRIVRAPGLTDPPAGHEDQPVPGVSADVGTSGAVSARATLTRSAMPGLHGWQKKSDDREAWLTVNGTDFQWTVPVPVSRTEEARRFAAAITTAGRRAAP